ncbi:MAG: acyl carrier protein [Deltaproteobacteria bacterium]|nr:acyl carrier protein [Deltaproteobacteria bacterium]
MSPREAEILATLGDLLARETGTRREVALGADLQRDLQLDSMSLLSLAVRIEDTFLVRLDEDGETLRTVGDLVSLIERRLDEAVPKEVLP